MVFIIYTHLVLSSGIRLSWSLYGTNRTCRLSSLRRNIKSLSELKLFKPPIIIHLKLFAVFQRVSHINLIDNQLHSVEEDQDWMKKIRNQQRKMFNIYATLLQSDLIHYTRKKDEFLDLISTGLMYSFI